MKKTVYSFICIFMVAFFLGSCSPSYFITAEHPKGSMPRLKKYKQIHVGWINLDEKDWKRFGFKTRKAWKSEIRDMNIKGMQKFLKEDFLTKKKITGAISLKRDKLPKKGGLYIKFINATYESNYNFFTKQPDKLSVSMEFYDIQSKKRIYKGSVYTWSKEKGFTFGGISTGSITFEARLNTCIYDIARFIAEKINK